MVFIITVEVEDAVVEIVPIYNDFVFLLNNFTKNVADEEVALMEGVWIMM